MKKVIVLIMLFSTCLSWAADVSHPIRVGLLLPLQADVLTRDKNMNRFADFYTGALMAVYEKQATGQPVELYTYDVGKSVHPLQAILDSSDLHRVDMVIGPVYPSQVRMVAEWSSHECIRTLLPFSSEVPEIETNPYLMQFNPSSDMESEAMTYYLSHRHYPLQCVLVEADEMQIPESVHELQQQIKGTDIEYTYTTLKQIMSDSLFMVLSDSVENVLLLNTERYANVRAIMPWLMRAAQGKQLTLLSRYSWQGQPIALSQIYASVFKENLDIDSTTYGALYQRFIPQQRAVSHPDYGVLGYDLMNYALQTIQDLQHSEEGEKEDVLCRKYTGIQSDIHFERLSERGGYVNKNIHIIRLQ